jgi:hypothetical protein
VYTFKKIYHHGDTGDDSIFLKMAEKKGKRGERRPEKAGG